MGSDMIVALKEASANQSTLFALNHHAAPTERLVVVMAPGQLHDAGEVRPTSVLNVAQARQTFSVLGMQPPGQWGFAHGVNEHRIAMGVTEWQSRLTGEVQALGGPDLVRLALERSHSAHHAVEVVIDLLEHHGHNPCEEAAPTFLYLIADCDEAYVIESCGRYWALLECGHTRVVTDAAMIRQDWRRLAPGLADFVIDKGWAQDDGSKIDFAGCLAVSSERSRNAQKRWGRASLALTQQQGAIDLHFLRRLLADHYATNRELVHGGKAVCLANSFLVDLHKNDQPIIAWTAFGPPSVAVHFPICMAGELPAAFGAELPAAPTIQQCTCEMLKLTHGKDRVKLTQVLERLQTKFDQDADDFLVKTHQTALPDKSALVAQLATEMMHRHVDLFDKEYRRLFGLEEKIPQSAPAEEESLFFA